ncbi:MAG: metallophosphoesterase [Candidatus Omnitrophota bacterium]
MKIFAFSDWRTQSIKDLICIVKKVNPDVIFYAGDDLERIVPYETTIFLKTKNHLFEFDKKTISTNKYLKPESVNDFLAILTSLTLKLKKKNIITKSIFSNIPFFFVNGNDDKYIKLKGDFYHRIHGSCVRIKHGLESSILCVSEKTDRQVGVEEVADGDNKYNIGEEGFYLKYKIKHSFGHFTFKGQKIFGYESNFGLGSRVLNKPTKKADIFLTHIPPLGQLDLSARYGIYHIGSRQVLNDLKRFKPKFIICGHSHFWGGKQSNINKTKIINTSSHDRDNSDGNYVIIDTKKSSFQQHSICFKNIYQIRGGRSVLDELRREIYDPKAEDSFSKINLLSHMNEFKDLAEKKKLILNTRVKERLSSLKWKRPKVISRLSFDPDKCVYLDVETGLAKGGEPGKLWLIGVLCNGEVKHFLFPGERKKFQKYLLLRKEKPIVSWTNYDQKVICDFFKTTNRWIDACARVANCVIWYDYRLAELYSKLFGLKETTSIDGATIGILADHIILDSRKCSFCPKKKEIITLAINKNRIDLLQMYKISKFLWSQKGL